jgi:hypothetical protein
LWRLSHLGDYSPNYAVAFLHSGGRKGETFKNLLVWQKAVALSLAVYRLTSAFPRSEQFGLTDQMRRASVSVASNIAEGNGRSTRGEYL